MGKIGRIAHGQERSIRAGMGRTLSLPCVIREINLKSGEKSWQICSQQIKNVNLWGVPAV